MKTPFDSAAVPVPGGVKALENPFMKCVVRVIRAKDLYGLWSDVGDAELLAKLSLRMNASSGPDRRRDQSVIL